MADKKITVLGDAPDESLTPEEEHKIEVKIDSMLAVDGPEKQDEPAAAKSELPKIEKKKTKVLVIDDSEEKSIDEIKDLATETAEKASGAAAVESKTAPPVPGKAGKKVKIAITKHGDEAEKVIEPPVDTKDDKEVTSPEAEKPTAETPKSPVKIKIVDNTAGDTPPLGEETTEAQPEQEAAQEQVPETEPEEAKPEELAEPVEESAPALSEEPTPAVEETKPEIAPAPEAKKYRPPDGPIPFKRAQPEQTGEIVDDFPKDLTPPLSDEDAEIAKAFEPAPKAHRKAKTLPGRKLVTSVLVAIVLLVVAAAAALPSLRAQALSLVGMRGTVSARVVDGSTHMPLPGATLSVGGLTTTTDSQGSVLIKGVKLGSQQISVRMAGYAAGSKTVLLAWTSVSAGDISLQETGTKYQFAVTSYVSDKPMAAAVAESGSSKATADSQGNINLLVDPSAAGKQVSIMAAGYQTYAVDLPKDPTAVTHVQLVPSTPDIYVAKIGGKFNVYKIGVDGHDKDLLLAGTGNETSDMSLVVNNTGQQVAFVAKRDNQKDKAGYLLDTLTLLNVETGASTSLAHAQQIRVLGWQGANTLVYTALKADAATNDPARQQILTYDTVTKKTTEIDHANSFNDVALAKGSVYYATANHFSGGTSQLYGFDLASKTKQTLLTSEVTDILRTDYNDLVFMTAGSSYAYKLGSAKPVAATTTSNGNGRLYVDSPDGKHSVWVDTTNHKLMLYTQASGTETVLTSQADLAYPVRWLDNSTLLFRTSNANVAADYVTDLQSSSPKKVTIVVDAAGQSLWQD